VTDDPNHPPDAVEIPIDGTLDLHTFAPRDVADVVGTYLDECLVRAIITPVTHAGCASCRGHGPGRPRTRH
jgi:hypothetical protein